MHKNARKLVLRAFFVRMWIIPSMARCQTGWLAEMTGQGEDDAAGYGDREPNKEEGRSAVLPPLPEALQGKASLHCEQDQGSFPGEHPSRKVGMAAQMKAGRTRMTAGAISFRQISLKIAVTAGRRCPDRESGA